MESKTCEIYVSMDVNSAKQWEAVNLAFSKQSTNFDQEDSANKVLHDMRQQVYAHVEKIIKPNSHILELNAGTGIDACHFVSRGHRVHATDLSQGMVQQIIAKIEKNNLHNCLTCEQLSYDELNRIHKKKFDYVFSNFGGLNCIQDLHHVTKNLPSLLKPGAHVTWVIMPRIYIWELLGLLKGHGKKAFRRFNKQGVHSHLEGEFFTTYYHSLADIRAAFKPPFKFISSEGLAALSPPPHRPDFPVKYPRLYKSLRKLDLLMRWHFPFNQWADHIIVTFEYNPA